MPSNETPARPVLPDEIERTVSLREFEQRLAELSKHFDEKVTFERELRTTRALALDEALKLQAAEYARRLEDLNHAHALAMENWARSLPREMFDQWKEEHGKWRESVTMSLTSLLPLASNVSSLGVRVAVLESLSNRLTGAFILLGVMGLSGVLALVLGLARLIGLVK